MNQDGIGRPGDVMALSAGQPLYRGHQRLVFQHPEDPGLLIKVMRPEYVQDKYGPAGAFRNRHRRCRHYHPFLTELREYLVACARSPECLPFLQEIVGLLRTDLGLGLVVRKVCGPEGGAAPTLARLAREGALDAGRRQRLDAFQAALLASPLVVDDLNANNLVLGVDPAGGERFVLIDGVGSSTLIPLKALVQRVNVRSKLRRFARLRASLGQGEG